MYLDKLTFREEHRQEYGEFLKFMKLFDEGNRANSDKIDPDNFFWDVTGEEVNQNLDADAIRENMQKAVWEFTKLKIRDPGLFDLKMIDFNGDEILINDFYHYRNDGSPEIHYKMACLFDGWRVAIGAPGT